MESLLIGSRKAKTLLDHEVAFQETAFCVPNCYLKTDQLHSFLDLRISHHPHEGKRTYRSVGE